MTVGGFRKAAAIKGFNFLRPVICIPYQFSGPGANLGFSHWGGVGLNINKGRLSASWSRHL